MTTERQRTRQAVKLAAVAEGRYVPDSSAILNALAAAVLVVDSDYVIHHVNATAEVFFAGSEANLVGQRLNGLVPPDSPLFAVIDQAFTDAKLVVEYHVAIASPRIGRHMGNVRAAPISDGGGFVVLSIQEQSVAAKIEHQLSHRRAARSVSAMAAMLAHEVKNPLAGIRGAAQLLEVGVKPEDRALTQLIRDESDRVCGLVDRMEVFSTSEPLQREAVNIHTVLNRVTTLAETSFGRGVRFIANYDPSLPAVDGNRDQLIQVFLNLVKNAAEAVPENGGEVIVTSAYWHGVRLAVSRRQSRVHLPLMISVQDNGPGIADDMKPYLFDPFVTSKPNGSGLGLALVAKIVEDHGGVIEFESQPRRTIFRVFLPVARGTEDSET